MRQVARRDTLGLAILFLSGCSLDSGFSIPDVDAGFLGSHDAATGDAGTRGPHDPAESAALGASCYDGVDNDDNDALDCLDPQCTLHPVCCVGSAVEGCCRSLASDLALAPPAACDGAPATDCDELPSGLTFFGETPRFEEGGLVAQGDRGHVGVVLGAGLDPRRTNVELSATIAVPDASMRCNDCTDVVGLALIDAVPATGERAVIRLGLLVNGPLEELRVLVADEVVQRLPLLTNEGEYSLALRVDGSATLRVPGEAEVVLDDLVLEELTSPIYPAILGRTDNRSAGQLAVSAREARLRLQACDVPAALSRRRDAVMPARDAIWSAENLGRLSAAVGGPQRGVWVAFERNGDLHMAGETSHGELRGAPVDPSDPVVQPPTAVRRLLDPWLMVDPDASDRWLLFFAAEDEDGVRRIYRASGPAGWGRTFAWPSEAEIDLGVLPGASSIDGPSVWRDPGGSWHMVARVTDEQGSASLALLDRGTDGVWRYREGSLASARIRAPETHDLFAFDRDAVAAPAMVLGAGERAPLWRLYYAGRRGTRWSIGALISEDGRAWRPLGPVLAGEGGTSFDALSVTDPAPVALESGIRLYYRGSDGAVSAYGVAGPFGTLSE